MILDLGLILQAATLVCSLAVAKCLSDKRIERWGYLIAFVSLPLWMALEVYYHEWLYFILNPVYFIWYGKALKQHWRKNNGDK